MSFLTPPPSVGPTGPAASATRSPARRRPTLTRSQPVSPRLVSPRLAGSRFARTLLAVGLLALGGIASIAAAPTAAAHDELTGTAPGDRSTVATAPDAVVLHFTETPVTVGLAVRVTGPTGDVQDGTARIDGKDVTQPLLPSAPAGAYRVAWRVTAEDGHASSGELTFTASAANPRGATATPGAQTTTGTPGSTGAPGASPATPTPGATPATTSPAVAATSATTSSGTGPVAAAVVVLVLALLAGLVAVLIRRSRGARART